jgi:predicted nucleotidyltransferase
MIASDQDLELLLATVLRHCDPERIYLFGSQGRRDARESSDIDLLIVESSGLPRRQRGKRVIAALRSFPATFDLLFYTPHEITEELLDPTSFIATVIGDGRLVYERAPSGSTR